MIRIGIAGFGAMGQVHAQNLKRNLAPGAKLTAVFDPSADSLARARSMYPGVECFGALEAMLDQVDAVILATPHALHVSQAMTALERGVHVLTEKPLGIRASQAEKAQRLAEEKGLVYCVMFNQRALAINQKIKEIIFSGALGALRRTILICTDCYRPQSYFDSGSWRATWKLEGGGMLVNQCSHSLDLLSWWLGMPEHICAHIGYGKWHEIEADDDISVFAEYANGGTLHIIASTGDVPGTNVLEIQGDAGKLSVNREGNHLTWYRLSSPESVFTKEFEGGIGAPDIEKEEMDFSAEDRGHLRMLRNFTASIRGEEEPICPAGEAIKALRFTQAIYLSSWQGGGVSLPLSDQAFDEEYLKRESASVPRVPKPVAIDFTAVWNQKR